VWGFEVLTREKPMLKKFLSFDNWTKMVVVYMWASMFIGKAAAYLGLLIGALTLFSTRVLWDRWYRALTFRSDPMRGVGWALLVSILYGIAQVIYGVSFLGYSPLTALQILVFNLGPAYLFLGVWVGIRHPGAIRTYIRFMAWWMVIYTPIYFLFLQHLNLSLTGILPGTGLDLLGNPGSGTLPLLGLLTLEPQLARFWIPIVVLVLLTIANQERSDWLGLGVCLVIWGKLSGKLGRVFGILGCIATVLIIAALIDLKLPPIPGRGGELSARGTIARMAGAISPELAADVGGGRDNAQFYYGTVYWRQHWWAAIRSEVFKEPKTEIFGLGYGYPLAHLAGVDVEKQGTRSPHSVFYFTLAYSGFVGVAIFFWLEICILWLLWRVYEVSGETFGLMFAIYTLIGAFFGNVLETPQAAIPFYLLCGMALSPIFLRTAKVYDDEQAMPAHMAEFV
jgi:hypothetical protein